MITRHEKQQRHAASWILKSLCTNESWTEELRGRKKTHKRYLYVPLFSIAGQSKRYDLNTLKETCYLLRKNRHVHIWGDDFDPRAMLVQVSAEGIEAHKKSLYGNYTLMLVRRNLAAATGIAAAVAIVIGMGRYTATMKHAVFQNQMESKQKAGDASQNADVSFRKHTR